MDKTAFEAAHMAALNPQQRAAVEAVNGPVPAAGGAGQWQNYRADYPAGLYDPGLRHRAGEHPDNDLHHGCHL